MKKNRLTNQNNIFVILKYVILAIISLFFLIPFLTVISTSFMTQKDIIEYGTLQLIPKNIDLSAYKMVLSKDSLVYSGYMITGIRVLLGTLLNLIITSGLAYGLSKKHLVGRNLFITLIFITMIFNGGLIPTYMVVKMLGLTDSIWSLIFPALVNAYNFILMKTFFSQIPESLEESANIDGANPVQILVKIVIPLSLPAIATIGLFYGVAHWNAWFDAAIYINDYKKMPLQIILRDALVYLSADNLGLSMTITDTTIKKPPTHAFRSAIIMVSTVPILLVYPFIQKYFVKGVMVGSIKG